MKAFFVPCLCLLVLSGAIDLHAQTGQRHEFVTKGNHKQELALGDYLVIKTFAAETEAQKECEEIKKSGIAEIVYGYLTNKELWYVCLKSSGNIEEAKTLQAKYGNAERFKDAWLLTVHQ